MTKVGERVSNTFSSVKGVRQGCTDMLNGSRRNTEELARGSQ